MQDGDETDVDCGGPTCAACPPGGACETDDDCSSGVCDELLATCDAPQLATGATHTCVALRSGAVRCWGEGELGQHGHPNHEAIGDDELPADVGDVEVGAPVLQVVAGNYHTCALLESGAVRCWGAAAFGMLGYGNLEPIGDDEAPASAGNVDVGGPVVQLSAGETHTCALLEGGTVRCWGDGLFGRLGYGNVENIGDDETPASAGDVDVGGPVVQIDAGAVHTCALLEGGSVRCWGYAIPLGYLFADGLGHVGDDETPADAGDVDVGGPVVQLAAGEFFTCAVLEGGTVRCWGSNDRGQLGYPGHPSHVGDDETPAMVGDVDVGGTVARIVAARRHTCALLEDGAVRCWGDNDGGLLGYGHRDRIGDDETPASAGDVDVGGPVEQLETGWVHTCARLEGGAIRCWGFGRFGALGYGNTNNIGDGETPASAGNVDIR